MVQKNLKYQENMSKIKYFVTLSILYYLSFFQLFIFKKSLKNLKNCVFYDKNSKLSNFWPKKKIKKFWLIFTNNFWTTWPIGLKFFLAFYLLISYKIKKKKVRKNFIMSEDKIDLTTWPYLPMSKTHGSKKNHYQYNL